MYERFTDNARQAMIFAQREAKRLQHGYVGTEHILLGLLKVGSGAHIDVFAKRSLTPAMIEGALRNFMGPQGEEDIPGKLPQTPRAKKVIEYSIEESRRFDKPYIGVEHLLLALIREVEGLAGKTFESLNLTLDATRADIAQW